MPKNEFTSSSTSGQFDDQHRERKILERDDSTSDEEDKASEEEPTLSHRTIDNKRLRYDGSDSSDSSEYFCRRGDLDVNYDILKRKAIRVRARRDLEEERQQAATTQLAELRRRTTELRQQAMKAKLAMLEQQKSQRAMLIKLEAVIAAKTAKSGIELQEVEMNEPAENDKIKVMLDEAEAILEITKADEK